MGALAQEIPFAGVESTNLGPRQIIDGIYRRYHTTGPGTGEVQSETAVLDGL